MTRVPFVDVSEHQGHIDWAKMLAAGVGYVIIRAGINGRLDNRIDEYVTGARAAGVTVLGLYWFVNPKSSASAEQQAQIAIAACQRYQVRMLMYDLESYAEEPNGKPALSGQAYMAWLDRFDAQVRTVGLVRVVYTNASYWNPLYVGVGSPLADCDVVVATYPWYGPNGAPTLVDGYPPDRWEERAFFAAPRGPLTPAGFDHWDAWQFSAGFNQQGPVYGASSGNLDLNFADPDAVKRWLDDPLDPQEEEADFMYVVLQMTDAVASFLAQEDADGRIFDAEWINFDATAFGCPVRQHSWRDLGYVRLTGPLPTNDIKHTWDGSEFRQWPIAYEPQKGDKGDPGADAPIPKSLIPVYE